MRDQKIIKIIKNKIHSVQNVGKVWISGKKPPDIFWDLFRLIFPWTRKLKEVFVWDIFLGGPSWSYLTGLGSYAGVIGSQEVDKQEEQQKLRKQLQKLRENEEEVQRRSSSRWSRRSGIS